MSATVESRVAGAELNMDNVSLDKGSSLAVAKVSDVIRVRREELEAENTGESSTANVNDGDNTTGKSMSTSSKSTPSKGTSDDTLPSPSLMTMN